MIGWPLKVLLIFELILIFYIVPLIEILRLILCILLLKLFILIVNLIIFRHFNAQVSSLVTLFLVSFSLLIIVHSLSIISLKVLNLVALIIEFLKVLVISLIYFQILRSILPRLMLTLIELSLLLSAFILIIVLTRRIILILFKRRWRLRVLWKRNRIFNARSWRIHYAIQLLVKLLLLKIHCMEDLLGSLMLVIIHVDRIMMSAMVDLEKMRLRRIGYQHTSVQLSSFVQVLPHLPGLILKSFNFVQKRQIAHLKQLSLLRILNTGIQGWQFLEPLLINTSNFLRIAAQNLLIVDIDFLLLITPYLLYGSFDVFRVLIFLHAFLLSFHDLLLACLLFLYLLIVNLSRIVYKHIFVLHLAVVIQQRIFVLLQVLKEMQVELVIHFQIRMQNVHHPGVEISLQDFAMLNQFVILKAEHAESTVEVVIFRRC